MRLDVETWNGEVSVSAEDFHGRRKVLTVWRFSFAKRCFSRFCFIRKHSALREKTFRWWQISAGRLKREQIWFNEERIAERIRRGAENDALARTNDFLVVVWSTRL